MPYRSTKIVATLGPSSNQPDILEKMIAAGVNVVRLNFSHGKAQDHIDRARLVREAASAKPDAIVIHCTNFRGLPGAVGIEAETGISILDSVAVALWGAIRAAGRNPTMIQGAGRLFRL